MKFVIDIPDDLMNKDVIQDAIKNYGGIHEDWLLGQFGIHRTHITNHMGIRVLKDHHRIVESVNCEFKYGDKVIFAGQPYTVDAVRHEVVEDDHEFPYGESTHIELVDTDGYGVETYPLHRDLSFVKHVS
jgi:hypothetical protein